MAARIDRKKQELFVEHYKLSGFNITEACKKTPIGRRTYYDWLEDPEFEKKMEEGREELIDLVELELQKQIKNGNTMATIYFLNCQGGKRGWSQKQEVKHEHSGTIDVHLIDRYQMPKDNADTT